MHRGYVKSYRKVVDSEIWMNKPCWWFKVWTFILIKVNHSDRGRIKRGSNFFNANMIHTGCHLGLDGVKRPAIDNVIRWLKQGEQIVVQKTTRGMIVTVCNYDVYQSQDGDQNGMENGTGTEQERNRNGTINKNDKNVKNDYIKKQSTTDVVNITKDDIINAVDIFALFKKTFKCPIKRTDFLRNISLAGFDISRDVFLAMTRKTDVSNPVGFFNYCLKERMVPE